MLLTIEQRRALGAFIRARREALLPLDHGLSPHGRRRTPGLRREEVAQLAGISTTWYTWVEQGRDISMSATALAQLANALSLSAAERAYLFELSRHRDPAEPVGARQENLPAEVAAMIDGISHPAYVSDRLFRACHWNEAAAALLGPWLSEGDASLLRYMFLDPSARSFVVDWEERAQRLLAEFRADMAHSLDDEEIARLVSELTAKSTDFARLWTNHRVLSREGGIRRFNHLSRGEVQAEQMTFMPMRHPDYRLVVLLCMESDP
ncbi:helix-turn-helix transcriptional regulator [Sphingobium sp. HBC34]|uniref:Helix-turn-helix transcriptional regulator n=1 Tax=Sphingobium cyanobacteriorum TaxID=3063954 RepID=A0ABT8ZQ10_9SPHN|nr:helix-turn-helix transcriptional regulator [Sphingobium sp. HBC34]MDO7836271.1 helix-turn-helix transcriptional regulator [Sphingobium sp. HBC34]